MLQKQFFIRSISLTRRIHYLKQFYSTVSHYPSYLREALEKTHQLMDKYHYQIKVSRLAKELGYGERSLRRFFQRHLGLSPKHYLRIYRIFRAMEYMEQHPSKQVITFSYRFGFYDQAHFVREFKSFLKLSPSEFLHIQKQQNNNFYTSSGIKK